VPASAAPPKEIGWDWVPPHASEAALREWRKPWTQRARDVLFPNDETFRNYFLAMIESFTPDELAEAIRGRRDIVEGFVTVSKVRHRFVKGAVKFALRRNNYHAFRWLVGWPGRDDTGPPGMWSELNSRDPVKGALLSSPDGWAWFQGECYELARFFRWFAQLDQAPYNWPEFPPPPGHRPRPFPDLHLPAGTS
jgi:hypothetical protein